MLFFESSFKFSTALFGVYRGDEWRRWQMTNILLYTTVKSIQNTQPGRDDMLKIKIQKGNTIKLHYARRPVTRDYCSCTNCLIGPLQPGQQCLQIFLLNGSSAPNAQAIRCVTIGIDIEGNLLCFKKRYKLFDLVFAEF